MNETAGGGPTRPLLALYLLRRRPSEMPTSPLEPHPPALIPNGAEEPPMPNTLDRLSHHLSFCAIAFLLAPLSLALTAQSSSKPAGKVLDLPTATKRKALAMARPELLPEDVEVRVRRLEAAWLRAQAQGLLRGPEWQAAIREGRLKILEKAFLDHRSGHPGMTAGQIQAAFLAQGDQRRVSHLLCATEAMASAALKRIQAGEPFAKVASEVSKDVNAAATGGDLGWIRQREVVASFGDPVFAASIGDLVGPIETQFGWHVAKTLDVHSPTVAEFLSQKDVLLQKAADAQRAAHRELALEGLRPRYPLQPDLSVLGDNPTTESGPGDEARIAGRVAGMTISLGALNRSLADVIKVMGQSHAMGSATKTKAMEGLADQIRLAMAAQKRGLERKLEIRAALWADERERAYARFSSAFLATVKIPDSELQPILSAHPDRFRPVGGLRLQVLVADSKDRVDEALNHIRRGMAWTTAAASYGSAESTGNPDPGWVDVDSLRKLVPLTLMQPLLTGPLGQPVGPMLGPDGFMIFNVLERRPGPSLPLAECREAVRAEYLKEKGPALVEQELGGPLKQP